VAHRQSGLQTGGKFASVHLDVSDRVAINKLWERVPGELRNVDILGELLPSSFMRFLLTKLLMMGKFNVVRDQNVNF